MDTKEYLVPNSNQFMFRDLSLSKAIEIYSGGKTLVSVAKDGTIEYGEGYAPDKAAKEFWDAIGLEHKSRTVNQ